MNTATALQPERHNTFQFPRIETLSGNSLSLGKLEESVMTYDEAALVLCRLPVLNGHQLVLHPYTIAHHSLWVMSYVMWNTGSPLAALYALVYRAHEAYLGSVPQVIPAQIAMKRWRERVQHWVHANLGLSRISPELTSTIAKAGRIATAIEMERLLPQGVPNWFEQEIPAAARDIRWNHTLAGEAYGDMITAHQWLHALIREADV